MTDNGLYMKNYMNNIGYLIRCNSPTQCEKLTDLAHQGYYVNAGASITNNPLILFDAETPEINEKTPDSKDSYYLDSSSFGTNSYSSLIFCSSTKNCTSIEPDDGYFYNSGFTEEDVDAIIECDKIGCKTNGVQTCTTESSTILKPGNYCYQREIDNGNDMNFVVNEFTINSENIESTNLNITYATSNTLYRYVTVEAGNFPGINRMVSTLFEIKSNSITRIVNDGVYIINAKYEKIDGISGSVSVGNAFTIYTCSTTTQLCSPSQTCKAGEYLYDEKTGKGYQCDGSFISPIYDEGYYVDSSYTANQGQTPAIIKCESTGSCERFMPVNAYFINSGSDRSSRPLIYCSGSNCVTQPANAGYYRAEFGHSGVIICSSSTSCKLSNLRYSYYTNAGVDKISKSIIYCTKGTECNTKRASAGYYLVQDNTDLLINCKSSSICEVEKATVGYYYNAVNNEGTSDSESIINCISSTYTDKILCSTEKKNEGFYLSGSSNNVLVDCSGSKCKTIEVENGIFASAGRTTSSKNAFNKGRDKYTEDGEEIIEEDDYDVYQADADEREFLSAIVYHSNRNGQEAEENKQHDKEEEEADVDYVNREVILQARASTEVSSTLIICSGGICNELTAEEVKAIPICNFNNDVCYIDNSRVSTQTERITSVVAGEFCTDSSRSTIYFATETIVEYNDIISNAMSSSTSKTAIKNCIKASSQYSNNLFTVGNKIYKVSEGLILEVHDAGYYFININKNVLVHGSEIKDYNSENVLLYKCDNSSCRIMDKPTSDTYYTDVSKRIIKYSVEDNKYSFANSKQENVCVFEENTCTPKYDIEENDFCITAEGYLVVAGEKIKSRETGKCYMSTSINTNALAYSYSANLYLLNSNAAKQVTTTGYFFAENSKYQSAEYRVFNSTRSGITLYGCINKNCQVVEPEPDVFYFDMLTNYLIQKKDNTWISPFNIGYINVSVSPNEKYIYSYTISDNKELLLTKTTKNGYYYTIDGKMYYCDSGIQLCAEIDNTAYILTNGNELYYCVVDSEGEATECFKRTCTVGQIYYIKDNYYKCLIGSYFETIKPKSCQPNDVVVINFPLIYSGSFPNTVHKTISNIAKNNHYVPTEKVSRTSLETVQGVFTNCTYNVYDDLVTYDQICMANHVKLNQDKEPDICSIQLLGYTFCTVDEGDDPNKCNPSSAYSQINLSMGKILTLLLSTLLFFIIY